MSDITLADMYHSRRREEPGLIGQLGSNLELGCHGCVSSRRAEETAKVRETLPPWSYELRH